MNKILLFFIVLIVSLQARLDPFEPVIIKKVEKKSYKPYKVIYYSPDDKGRTVKLIPETENKHKKYNSKKIKILKNNCIINKKNKNFKNLKNINKTKKTKSKVVKIKKFKEFIPVTYKVLPFITIDIGKKYISAISRPKYKVLRYYFLKDEKKVVFDFRAKVDMRTRYKIIENHPFFKAYKIGNHPDLKDYFFRVVIELKKSIDNFKVIINQNKATLIYKK